MPLVIDPVWSVQINYFSWKKYSNIIAALVCYFSSQNMPKPLFFCTTKLGSVFPIHRVIHTLCQSQKLSSLYVLIWEPTTSLVYCRPFGPLSQFVRCCLKLSVSKYTCYRGIESAFYIRQSPLPSTNCVCLFTSFIPF